MSVSAWQNECWWAVTPQKHGQILLIQAFCHVCTKKLNSFFRYSLILITHSFISSIQIFHLYTYILFIIRTKLFSISGYIIGSAGPWSFFRIVDKFLFFSIIFCESCATPFMVAKCQLDGTELKIVFELEKSSKKYIFDQQLQYRIRRFKK